MQVLSEIPIRIPMVSQVVSKQFVSHMPLFQINNGPCSFELRGKLGVKLDNRQRLVLSEKINKRYYIHIVNNFHLTI